MSLHYEKFVHTKTGGIIMSILLGLGFATLFREVCKGKNCKILKPPPLDSFQEKIYKVENKCVSYSMVPTKCDNNKKIINM